MHLAAERVLKNREHNRKRYHEMRDLLRIEHPELFATHGDPHQTLLTDDAPRSKDRVFDLTFFQKNNSCSSSAAAAQRNPEEVQERAQTARALQEQLDDDPSMLSFLDDLHVDFDF